MLKFDVASVPTWLLTILIISNSMWIVVYILAIRLGFKEKTYSIPMTALATNLSWEFIFSFVQPHPAPILYSTMGWVVFDFVLAYQYLKFGKSDFIPNLSTKWVPAVFMVAVLFAAPLVLAITQHFGDEGWHAAYIDNMMMSIMFPLMLLRRNSVAGQSLYIAVLKGVSTMIAAACFTYIFGVYPLILTMAFIAGCFDILYMVMVYAKCREQGINPWLRA